MDGGVGVLGGERRPDFVQVRDIRGVDGGDDHAAAKEGSLPNHDILEPPVALEDIAATLVVELPGGCEPARPGRAVEELDPEFDLEAPDPLRRGRLRDPVLLRPREKFPSRTTSQKSRMDASDMVAQGTIKNHNVNSGTD